MALNHDNGLIVYLSVDMEGATGVVSPLHVEDGKPEYAFGCMMQQHDMLAVVEGAIESGLASRIIVNDSHDRMINLDPSSLPAGVEMISGSPKPMDMVEGVDMCDVAFFVCYHAMAGAQFAVLDHTMSESTIIDIKLNGKLVGETGLNAFYCGAFGKPVALVTGDDAVCAEAVSLLGGNLVVQAVKEGRGRHSALLLPPHKTREQLRYAAIEAMGKASKKLSPVMTPHAPFNVEATLHYTAQCDAASLVPGTVRLSGRTISFESESPLDVKRWISSIIRTAKAVKI